MQSKSSFYSPLNFPEWMSREVTYLYSASPLYSKYTDIPLNHYKVPLSYFFPIYEMFIAQFYLHVSNPYLAMFTQFDALVDQLNPIACTRKVSLTFYILTNIDSFVKNGTAYKIDLKPFFLSAILRLLSKNCAKASQSALVAHNRYKRGIVYLLCYRKRSLEAVSVSMCFTHVTPKNNFLLKLL